MLDTVHFVHLGSGVAGVGERGRRRRGAAVRAHAYEFERAVAGDGRIYARRERVSAQPAHGAKNGPAEVHSSRPALLHIELRGGG